MPLLQPVAPPPELAKQVMEAILAEPAPNWEPNHVQNSYVAHGWGVWLVACLALYAVLACLFPVIPSVIVNHLIPWFQNTATVLRYLLLGVQFTGRFFSFVIGFASSLLPVVKGSMSLLTDLWRIATTGPLLCITITAGILTLVGQSLLVHVLMKRPQHLLQ